MYKSIYLSGCPAATIAMWRKEVEALPKQKQEKWHKSGRNEEGTFRQVRFRGGHFQVKVLANTGKGQYLLPDKGWAPMVAEGEIIERRQILDTYGEEIMHMFDLCLGEENTRKNGVPYVMHPQSRRMIEAERRGGVKERDEELRCVMRENSTGNHHRNKFVKVETASGQPVRG